MGSKTTLPASWYCSHNMYAMEKRAVFLKSWYLLGPVVKFAVGEHCDYEIAGVQFRVFRVEGRSFRTFRPDNGCALPHHLTATGLLFGALSPSAPSFDEFFPGLEALLSNYDFARLPYRRSIAYEGNFNWKTMVDGYQECLHCQYTHRTFSVLYPPHAYEVQNHTHYSRHIADPVKPNDGLFLYFFPICTLNLYGGGMSAFRVHPAADGQAGRARMEFDYYHESEVGSPAFEAYFQFVRKVALEDFELCETAQANLQKGVYVRGVLNQGKENGVLYYQRRVREMVVHQFHAERAEKATVADAGHCRPAAQASCSCADGYAACLIHAKDVVVAS